MQSPEYTCSANSCDCGKSFPSQKALSGHLGGRTTIIFARNVVEHGTRRGYEKEIRDGLDPCVLCSAANARYMTAYRARRRLAARKGRK